MLVTVHAIVEAHSIVCTWTKGKSSWLPISFCRWALTTPVVADRQVCTERLSLVPLLLLIGITYNHHVITFTACRADMPESSAP